MARRKHHQVTLILAGTAVLVSAGEVADVTRKALTAPDHQRRTEGLPW